MLSCVSWGGGLSSAQMQNRSPTLDARHPVDNGDWETWGAGQHRGKVDMCHLGLHNTTHIEVKQSRDDERKTFRGKQTGEVPLCRPFSSDNFHISVYAPHFCAI